MDRQYNQLRKTELILPTVFFLFLMVFFFPWPDNFSYAASGAVLKVEPSSGSFETGETFIARVILDTGGQNVVAVSASLSYDPRYFEVEDVDTSGSCFSKANQCLYQGKPCQIIKNDKEGGNVKIIEGRQSPGVNSPNCLLAYLTIRGKKSSVGASLAFQESGQDKSAAILDDGQGTDILTGVENGLYVITAASTPGPSTEPGAKDTTPPSISGLKVSGITNNSAEINWQTDEPAKGKVYYLTSPYLELKEVGESGYKKTHSLTISGLSPATFYYFLAESEDAAGNLSRSIQNSFTTAGLSTGPTTPPVATTTPPVATTTPPVATTTPPIVINQQLKKIAALKAKIKELLIKITALKAQLNKILNSRRRIPREFRFENNLYPGQSGKEVEYLQIFLRDQGKDIYPEGLITGFFGNLTKKAVIRFQNKYAEDILYPWRLKQGTGTVGRTTRIKINRFLNK